MPPIMQTPIIMERNMSIFCPSLTTTTSTKTSLSPKYPIKITIPNIRKAINSTNSNTVLSLHKTMNHRTSLENINLAFKKKINISTPCTLTIGLRVTLSTITPTMLNGTGGESNMWETLRSTNCLRTSCKTKNSLENTTQQIWAST